VVFPPVLGEQFNKLFSHHSQIGADWGPRRCQREELKEKEGI
jgi:hypothetical protein